MCKGSDIIKVAAVAAAVYTGGASAGLWGAAEGAGAAAGTLGTANAVGAAGGDALGSLIASNATNWGIDVAAGVGGAAGVAASGSASATPAAAAPAASGGTGTTFLGALKTGAQLAPLASLAMAGLQPKMEAQGVPGVSPAPGSQAANTPAPNIFKKKIQGIDPTKTSGVGGVTDLSLGKATILGQ